MRFTHARIRPRFTGCNRLVLDTLDELLSGRTPVSALPLIAVVSGAPDGRGPPYFSLNNRRLWVLKELRARGLLQTVPARVRPTQDSRRLREKCGAGAWASTRRRQAHLSVVFCMAAGLRSGPAAVIIRYTIDKCSLTAKFIRERPAGAEAAEGAGDDDGHPEDGASASGDSDEE